MLEAATSRYLRHHGHSDIRLKAVLFDVDGALLNSVPYHADAWYKVMERRGLYLSREEVHMHGGRTGAATVNIVYRHQCEQDATSELIESIYAEKSAEFNKCPEPRRMSGSREILQKIKAEGLTPILVAGFDQFFLLDHPARNSPDVFQRKHMVTVPDIRYGKPSPEPYLTGLEKAEIKTDEAIVIENVPIGVRAGVATGIFTIAINTGPSDAQVLLDAGTSLLFPSVQALNENWERLRQALIP